MMRWLGHLAVLGLAVILLLTMQRTTPSYSDRTGPIPVEGRIGETVTARSFTIHVETIQLARQLRFEAFGEEKVRDTGGLWAVVTATAAARSESTTLSGAHWEGPTGLRYSQTNRLSGVDPLLIHAPLEPGLPKRGWFIFEIREDQVRGATFVAPNVGLTLLDSAVRVRLDTGDASPPISDSLDLDRLQR